MENDKEQGLSDFFTYEYQCILIRNAQMIDSDYENALMEYGKFFTADLIKCLCVDEKNNNNSAVVSLVNQFLDISNASCVQIEPCLIINKKPMPKVSISSITEFFLLIREVYHRWTSCDIKTAIEVLNDIFDSRLKVSELDKKEVPKNEPLYRGRVSEKVLEKVDMFHIPFMKAYKIRNQRFSITGQPLLYLTNSIYGIFNELSIEDKDYEKLYIAQYRFKQYDEDKRFVYDLTIDGGQLLQQNDLKSFSKLLYKFILGCVCGFPNVRGRDNSFFVEEYVIPQLVTQLLKNRNIFDGVCYNTIITNDYGFGESNTKYTCLENKPKNSSEEGQALSEDKFKISYKYINYAFFTEKRKSSDSMDLVLRDFFIIDGPITILDIPDYNPTEQDNNRNKIIEKIFLYYIYITETVEVPPEIKTNSLFQQFEKEVKWLYRDGTYRYIKKNYNKKELGDTE